MAGDMFVYILGVLSAVSAYELRRFYAKLRTATQNSSRQVRRYVVRRTPRAHMTIIAGRITPLPAQRQRQN